MSLPCSWTSCTLGQLESAHAKCQKPQGKCKGLRARVESLGAYVESLRAGVKGLRASMTSLRASVISLRACVHVTTGASRSCTAKAEGWHCGLGFEQSNSGPRFCEANLVPRRYWQDRLTRDNSVPSRSTEFHVFLWGQKWAPNATGCLTC